MVCVFVLNINPETLIREHLHATARVEHLSSLLQSAWCSDIHGRIFIYDCSSQKQDQSLLTALLSPFTWRSCPAPFSLLTLCISVQIIVALLFEVRRATINISLAFITLEDVTPTFLTVELSLRCARFSRQVSFYRKVIYCALSGWFHIYYQFCFMYRT